MSHDDMANLLDVYQADAATKSTTYILQFLWQDLTSSFDVVGPYYTSSKTMESKYILGVVLETVKLLFVWFQRMSWYGASSNLTTIKMTMGESGVFESTATIAPSPIQSFKDPLGDMSQSPSMCVYVYMHTSACVCVCW